MRWLFVLVSTAALASACGADPTGTITPPMAMPLRFADPQGDTIPASGTPTVRATDALATEIDVRTDVIIIRLEFVAPVTPWSQGLANGLDGFLDLDLDENPATGVPAAGDEFGGATGLGAEKWLDFRDDGAGTIDLVSWPALTRQPVGIRYLGTAVEITLPRVALGDPDGRFRMAYVLETMDRPVSDFVPNTGHYSIAPP